MPRLRSRINDHSQSTISDHRWNPRSLCPHELDEVVDVRLSGQLRRDPLERLARVQLRPDQEAVRLLQRLETLRREAAPLQADGVDAVGLRLGPVGLAERQHVLTNDGEGADVGVVADADELVAADVGAEGDPVADVDVAGEPDVVGEHGVRADAAVVRDVAVGHEEVLVADRSSRRGRPPCPGGSCRTRGRRCRCRRSAGSRSPRYFKSCGSKPTAREGKDAVALPERRRALNLRVRSDGRSAPEAHLRGRRRRRARPSTSASSSASGETIAVGWIRAVTVGRPARTSAPPRRRALRRRAPARGTCRSASGATRSRPPGAAGRPARPGGGTCARSTPAM